MKAVILAGGLGTRLLEETHLVPKPMIEIGGMPILWHIMKIYSAHDINEFIICCGYKGYVIKEYFANYFLHMSDVTIDMSDNSIEVHKKNVEPWKITLIDTGQHTQTGGRLKRLIDYLDGDQTFCFTYGDGLADLNISKLLDFHYKHSKLATITAVRPPGRYGAILSDGTSVLGFQEKPPGDGAWINGGFFVLDSQTLDYIDGDDTSWEVGPLNKLAEIGQLEAFHHNGFWHAMDTLRDKNYLDSLWVARNAPWHCWG
jgi:glucose-1-phosphate cytidylyltransferase